MSACHFRKFFSAKGFTLFELLVVIALIALLTGLTLGAIRSTGERQRVSRAEAELGVLSNALEQFRHQYGDYPQISPQEEDSTLLLLEILKGQRQANGAPMSPPGPSFLDPRELTGAAPDSDQILQEASLDPWGQPYVYGYAASGEWDSVTYLLYSRGPGQRHHPPDARGNMDSDHEDNLDNIKAQP